jgi:hypothetical protein
MLRAMFVVLCATGTLHGQASVRALRSPGGAPAVRALSGDGRILIGSDLNGPVMWVDGVASPLAFDAHDISADGRVIIGSAHAPEQPPASAVVISRDGVLERIQIPIPPNTGYGFHLSGDGRMLYGLTPWTDHPFPSFQLGFVASPAGVYMLQRLNGGMSRVYAMSYDGSVMIGSSETADSSVATRWVHGVASPLEPPSPGLAGAVYSDLSSDGGVLVGLHRAGVGRVFRQTGNSARVVASGQSVYAVMSGDGWRIVGSKDASGFAWDPLHGTLTLRAYALAYGLQLPAALPFIRPWLISDDGGTIIFGDGYGRPYLLQLPRFCYANCDLSTASPALNVEDFNCFMQKFRSGLAGNAADAVYANCDNSTAAPMLDAADFACFMDHYVRGCP